MFTRRASVFFLSIIILLQPIAAVAGEWGLPNDGAVSRGAFFRASVRAFELPVDASPKILPFRRVAKDMVSFVGVLESKGVLEPFGKDLLLARPITRAEAITMTVGLAGLSKSGDGKTTYRDIEAGSALARAVTVAVEQEWITPVRPSIFGADQELTGLEAEKLLKKASGRSGQQKRDDGSKDTGVQVIRINLSKNKANVPVPKSDILESVWQLINAEYLYQDKIAADKAAYGAIEGMVQTLGDPYTTFMRPANAQNFRNQIKGEVTGIGAQVEDRAGILTIVTPLRGSPAERAGLLPGDEILSADGVSLSGIGFLEAVDKVRGPKGTSVHLRIRRSGAEFDVSVTRDVVSVPEINITVQDGMGVVRLMQFGEITDKRLRKDMEELVMQNPRGIVLDLRNNPGGLEHAARIVVSAFVPKGSLVTIIQSKDGMEEHRTELDPVVPAGIPVAVLVNGGSASASEIVAGALQDAGRATIVGEKTFGKGTVQAVLQFQDLSSLKMTIAQWLTPKGRAIDKVGITPDIVVPYSSDRDEQLLKAMEILRR